MFAQSCAFGAFQQSSEHGKRLCISLGTITGGLFNRVANSAVTRLVSSMRVCAKEVQFAYLQIADSQTLCAYVSPRPARSANDAPKPAKYREFLMETEFCHQSHACVNFIREWIMH